MKSEQNKLIAIKRADFGKNASRRFRREGKIPANILEKGESIPVILEKKEFLKLLNKGLLPSMRIQLELEGETFEVLPKEIQRDPVSGEVIHVDLYKMTPGHKFHLSIPVELKGIAKGMKMGGALEHYIQILKIRTTPENLKEKIEVDISHLKVGDGIRLKELDLPEEWDILTRGNPLICKISQSRATARVSQ